MTPILLYLVGLMSFWVPPSDDMDLSRYRSIAADAVAVSEEEEVLSGLDTIEHAIVLLSVASFESRFNAAIDSGKKRGDRGQSVCLGGIRVLHDAALREKIAHDRKECFRRLLRRVRYSWNQCQGLEFDDRLSKYITGSCVSGHRFSRMYSARIIDALDGLAD